MGSQITEVKFCECFDKRNRNLVGLVGAIGEFEIFDEILLSLQVGGGRKPAIFLAEDNDLPEFSGNLVLASVQHVVSPEYWACKYRDLDVFLVGVLQNVLLQV